MNTMFSHGEVNFFSISKLPKDLRRVEIKDNYYIVGESETHGNDHRVAVLDKDNIEFFRDKFEKLYLKADVETRVYCPKEDRHDTIIIMPGIYEINKSLEIDPLTKKLREVAD
jgi:hypothetical protein